MLEVSRQCARFRGQHRAPLPSFNSHGSTWKMMDQRQRELYRVPLCSRKRVEQLKNLNCQVLLYENPKINIKIVRTILETTVSSADNCRNSEALYYLEIMKRISPRYYC